MDEGSITHSFGGDWTEEKLARLKEYLQAYVRVMKKQRFNTYYVDAFAGTGYRTKESIDTKEAFLFPELAEEETLIFLAGSAKKALMIEPPFSHYIFIEKEKGKAHELMKLKEEFPARKIQVVVEDANEYLAEWCSNMQAYDRAVMFLDPYGMQVRWKTIEAIARTEKVDLWYLFPTSSVMRLLRRNAQIGESERIRIDEILGTPDWFDDFYRKRKKKYQQLTFLEEEVLPEKTVDYEGLQDFFIGRLKSAFAGVARDPLSLKNSKNITLYTLYFAVSNKNGKKIALEIAQHILKR